MYLCMYVCIEYTVSQTLIYRPYIHTVSILTNGSGHSQPHHLELWIQIDSRGKTGIWRRLHKATPCSDALQLLGIIGLVILHKQEINKYIYHIHTYIQYMVVF